MHVNNVDILSTMHNRLPVDHFVEHCWWIADAKQQEDHVDDSALNGVDVAANY